MNKNLIKAVLDNMLDCDETQSAEIFNIFANNPERLSYGYEHGEYIFNIRDNRQAAKAVAMFGFWEVYEAAQNDWIIRAKKNSEGNWEFSNVAPSAQIEAQIEEIILDIVARPRDYPAWVWESIENPLICYLVQGDHYE